MSKIYVIHENSEWTVHLTKRLDELNLPYEEWDLSEGSFDLLQEPPEGIFYSRMSASSHTRGHRYAAEYTAAVLEWLESHGRTVVNGSSALKLEVSKAAQYAALQKHGITTPRTLVATGKEHIIAAAKQLGHPSFITKHNRAGKGLGVRLFHSIKELEAYVEGPEFEEPVDGITLIQQYIETPDQSITRCEFVGGKFVYAVKVDTAGGFELCPADACQIDDLFCPVGEQVEEKPSFTIQQGFNEPIIEKYEQFLASQGILVAGIEFMKDYNGTIYTYDINTNTNYNADAEKEAGIYGMLRLATYLGDELSSRYGVSK
ncbi:MAG: alpha-L-glutamate ligase [Niallia sp.]